MVRSLIIAYILLLPINIKSSQLAYILMLTDKMLTEVWRCVYETMLPGQPTNFDPLSNMCVLSILSDITSTNQVTKKDAKKKMTYNETKKERNAVWFVRSEVKLAVWVQLLQPRMIGLIKLGWNWSFMIIVSQKVLTNAQNYENTNYIEN